MVTIVQMLVQVLRSNAGSIVGSAAVAFASDALGNYPAQLVPAFIEAILALDDESRVTALNADQQPARLPLTGASGAVFTLPPAAAGWPAMDIARVFSRRAGSPEDLSVAELQLLVALLRPEPAHPGDEDDRTNEETGPSGDPIWIVPEALEAECSELLGEHVLAAL